MANPTPALSRRLSGSDAAFLYLERKEIPLNIACVAMFDGPVSFPEFVANIDSKLDLIPRYRQLAVPPPLNLGYPNWEYDPNFDIKRHIFHVRLESPGGEAELENLAGRLLSLPLDRGKPLWEIHLVDGMQDGRGALIARIHHALADGVAGAAILKIMFDPTLEGSYAVRKPRTRAAVPPRVEHTLAEQIASAIQSALENVVAAEAGLLSLAEGLLSDRGNGALQELATLLPELLQPPERFIFNKPCSGDRKFCWTEVDFSKVQAIRAALGGKVNDCILSVVVRAIARYIRAHGERVNGRFLRVVCPVNVRGDEQGESFGNRITFLPVILPLDVRDPAEMLRAVASRMEIMKNVRAAELVTIAASCLGTLPAAVQEMFWRGLPMIPLPIPLLNIICTNVPGPQLPLYSVGRRLLALYPQVPTGYELGLAVAVQSYDGKLFFGVTADAHVAPDANRLRDYIQDSFQELCKAAGLKRAPRRKTQHPANPTLSEAVSSAPFTAEKAAVRSGAAIVEPDQGADLKRTPRRQVRRHASPTLPDATLSAAAESAAVWSPAVAESDQAADLKRTPRRQIRHQANPTLPDAAPSPPVTAESAAARSPAVAKSDQAADLKRTPRRPGRHQASPTRPEAAPSANPTAEGAAIRSAAPEQKLSLAESDQAGDLRRRPVRHQANPTLPDAVPAAPATAESVAVRSEALEQKVRQLEPEPERELVEEYA